MFQTRRWSSRLYFGAKDRMWSISTNLGDNMPCGLGDQGLFVKIENERSSSRRYSECQVTLEVRRQTLEC